MKPQRFLRQILCAGWILSSLAGCSVFGSMPSTIPLALTPLSPKPTGTPTLPTSACTPVPPMGTTAPAVSGTPDYPVTGSVLIEAGHEATGGTAGETIQVEVGFSAASPFDKVDRMRVRPTPGCSATEADMETADWEPFASSKIFPVYLVINWVGFYVSAQFQDEHGNLSPVYCDDISVEGMPPMTLQDPAGLYR